MSDDRRWTRIYVAAVTVAVGALAGVLAQMTVFVPIDPAASTVEARVGATLLTVMGLAVGGTALASVTVVPLFGTLSGRVRNADVPWLLGLSLGGVVCLAIGFAAVQPFAGGFAEAHTETYRGHGGAHASFDVEVEQVDEERAILTFTHAGGDHLPADRISVRGEGFAAVEGVDQQEPGAWEGSVSGERPRRGGAIIEGDSVSVGVSDECMIRLVTGGDGVSSPVVAYDCRDR